MGSEKFKINSVIVDGGSGVLYQPLKNSNCTYILSAKHNFYIDNKLDKGLKKEVMISFFDAQNDKTVIELIKDANLFEHSIADAAVLKIDKRENVVDICIDEDCKRFNECVLCGYPGILRDNKNDNYSTYNISHRIDITQNGYLRLQTNFGNLMHEDISGFSGGGIFREYSGSINLIGIQSSTTTGYANGQIDVVPLTKYKEILINGIPFEIAPAYLLSFDFLRDKVFDFNAGADDDEISFTRFLLKQKALEVINSEITPIFIKDYFKEKLLINENNLSKLNDELIYITWLEFLTLINVVKSKACNIEDFRNVFSSIRLLYKRTETDWLASDFIKDCLTSNYEGLNEDGTVFIKTNKNPVKLNQYRVNKGDIISSISALKEDHIKGKSVYNGTSADIFNAIVEKDEFVFDKFNFIHFEYLKHVMLIENSSQYKHFNKLSENELLIKLKEEYGKIFRI